MKRQIVESCLFRKYVTKPLTQRRMYHEKEIDRFVPDTCNDLFHWGVHNQRPGCRQPC